MLWPVAVILWHWREILKAFVNSTTATERQPEVQEALDRGRANEHDRLVVELQELAMKG